jgi:glycosyltransferase involved in cell wall biosynthesis
MLAQARLRGIDVDWSFYCTVGRLGEKDEEARRLGARVINSPVAIAAKVRFVTALRKELRQGKYDVLHGHHDLVSAVYLLAASGISLSRRIVHVHNPDQSVLTPNKFKQFLYREPMRHICLFLGDRIVATSNHALDTFLAGRPRRPTRDVVHYCGLDLAPFESAAADRDGFRRQLGLPATALILLFAGRLAPEKNPLFAVDVLAELQHIEPRSVAVFAGAGPQEQQLVARAREAGLVKSVRLLGWRSDLAEIMTCCDWFILPHVEQPKEGFGLAVVEAQLAGLRMLLSQGVADDPLLPAANFRRLPLSAGSKAWAQAAIELLRDPAPSRLDSWAALRASSMELDSALKELLSLYA